jgi:hypothetical protein
MSPVLPDDSVLLTLPFGGAVLQKVGVSKPEIDAILEDFRKMYIDDKELDEGSFDFLTSYRRRLPPTIEVVSDNAASAGNIVLVDEKSIAAAAASAALIPNAEVGYLSPDNLSTLSDEIIEVLSTSIEKPESPDFFLPDEIEVEVGVEAPRVAEASALSDQILITATSDDIADQDDRSIKIEQTEASTGDEQDSS